MLDLLIFLNLKIRFLAKKTVYSACWKSLESPEWFKNGETYFQLVRSNTDATTAIGNGSAGNYNSFGGVLENCWKVLEGATITI